MVARLKFGIVIKSLSNQDSFFGRASALRIHQLA